MREKIKIKLKLHQNKSKGPSFKIFCDNVLLCEKINCKFDQYENTFDVELEKGKHSIRIQHFGKSPKDTDSTNKLDVAVQLDTLSFNSIRCSSIDLHQNYFYTSDWPYPVPKKIKDNLYFGFNGEYEYRFDTPSTAYVLSQIKKYKKEMPQLDRMDITEDEFLSILESHIKIELKSH